MGRKPQQQQRDGPPDVSGQTWITSAEACERLGLTDTWLRKLAEEGRISKRGHRWTTRYPWPLVRDQYFEHRETLLLEKYGVDGKARREAAEAEMAELKLAQMRGQFVTIEYMERELTRILQALRARLQGMPASWAGRLGAAQTTVDRQLMLEEAIGELMPLLQSDVIGPPPPDHEAAAA